MTLPDARPAFPFPDPPPEADPDGERSLIVEDQRFSIVPEWVIDADLPDAAFKLYALLLRFGGTSGIRMPSRQTLARRLRRSVDAVDRAMRALVKADVVLVEHRRIGGAYLTNRYYVRTTRPASMPAPDPQPERTDRGEGGGRASAAAPDAGGSGLPAPAAATRAGADAGGRTNAVTGQPSVPEPVETRAGDGGGRDDAAAGRTATARVAAAVRPDREFSTQRTPPPPGPLTERAGGRSREEEASSLMSRCGIADRAALQALAERCTELRRSLGQPDTRWGVPCIAAALKLAVGDRRWPAHLAVPALLAVAADRQTRSPMRVAEGGPWWDQPPAPVEVDPVEAAELAALERRLDDLDGRRPTLQAAARAELTAERALLNRASVVRRACAILDREAQEAAA